MKNILLILFAFVISFATNAQLTTGGGTGGGGGSSATDPTLPQITPTTPEAASLGRFGNVPINSATGQMSFTVPIYNIDVDGTSWPVSLQYNYGGFILEEKPSLTGWGWDLNAYASITRVVRGLPDGHPEGYYGENSKILQNMAYIDSQNPTINYLNMPVTDFMDYFEGKQDSEVDKYIVNIGGMNFSFKLRIDSNGDVVPYFLSPMHNYTVEIIMDTVEFFSVASFEITDDKGVKYFFEAQEGPVTINPEHPYSTDRTTSWLLTRIEYLSGEVINFNYTPDQYFSYDFSATGISLEGNVSEPGNEGVIVYSAGYNEGVTVNQMERQILTSIEFPKGSLVFGAVDRNGHEVYNSIQLKDHTGALVDNYSLSYVSVRDALDVIQKNGELYYDFDYYGIDQGPAFIPSFFESSSNKPWDQDLWSYYNDAGNTQAIHVGSQGGTANKQPNHNATRLGALQKIKYPTVGYSKIFYEQNTVKKSLSNGGGNSTTGYNDSIYLTLDPIVGNTSVERHKEVTKTFDFPVRATLYHELVGDVGNGNMIIMSITGGSGLPQECYTSNVISTWWYPEVIADARSKMRPPGTPTNPGPCDEYFPNPVLSPFFYLEIDPGNGCPWAGPGNTNNYQCVNDTYIDNQGNSGGDFWIMPGTYTFKISTHTNADSSLPTWFANGDLHAEMHLQFYDPDPGGTTDPSELFENVDVGGIRVHKIENYYDIDEKVTNIYNYNDEDGFSTAIENQNPYTFDKLELFHTNGGPTIHRIENYHSLNSFGAMDAANGVPVYYTKIRKYHFRGDTPVTTTTGDTTVITQTGSGTSSGVSAIYPEGYTQEEYAFPRHDVNYIYPHYPRNLDKSRASLLKTEQFDNEGNSVSETIYEYDEIRHYLQPEINSQDQVSQQDDNDEHPWSFKIVLNKTRVVNWDTDCYGTTNQGELNCQIPLMMLHTFQRYREVEKDLVVGRSESKIQGVTTVTNYERWEPNSEYYYLHEQTSIGSDGEEIKTTYEYPFHLTGEPQYAAMVNKKQISTPVVTKTYKNGVLTATQKTNYGLEGAGYRTINIQTAKGSNSLENRVLIDDYDGKGNVTQARKPNGEVISYLYGYKHNYVVAEIRGATYTEAIAALPPGINYNTDFQELSESSLLTALENVQNELQDAQVTYYSYKPLIGISTVTDSRGYRMSYHYNNQNRLEYTKDQDGNILQEYDYNYKTN